MPQTRLITKLDWSIARQLRNTTHSYARFAHENEFGAISRWDILLSFRQTRGLTMWIFFSPIYRMLRREQFDRHVNSSLNWIKTDHSEEMDSNGPHRWFLSKCSRTCSTSFMPSKSFEIYMIGASYTEHPVYVWPCRWWKQFSIIFYDQRDVVRGAGWYIQGRGKELPLLERRDIFSFLPPIVVNHQTLCRCGRHVDTDIVLRVAH